MATHIRLAARCLTALGEQRNELNIDRLIIAGWTGRDALVVAAHIAELQAIGVKPPAKVPMFYEVDCCLLTDAPMISVVGTDSSGEAEAVVVVDGTGVWVTVGSDHTDRMLETINVTKAKQICRKPIGSTFWLLQDIEAHWDQLEIRSFMLRDGRRTLYQEGRLAQNARPDGLLKAAQSNDKSLVGTALFCGTQPVIGSVEKGEEFTIELVDPVMKRKISHSYKVRPLEDLG